MKNIRSCLVLGLALGICAPAAAQRGTPNPRAGNVERILQMRDRLELSEEQITQLNQLRVTGVERRTAAMSALLDVQSRRAAGELSAEQARAFMAEQRAGLPAADGDRLDTILTEDQQARLRTLDRGRHGRAPRSAAGIRGNQRRGVVRRDGVRGGRSARGARGARAGRGMRRPGVFF